MKSFELENEIGKDQVVIVDSAFNFRAVRGWERAISLVVAEEASILIPRSDGTLIRSAFLSFPRPLVVALNKYVGTSIRKIDADDPATKSMILVRDDWTCLYCNSYGDTIDHIQPKSRGGKNTWGNLCVACKDCNRRKDNKTPSEMGWDYPVIPKTLESHRKKRIQGAIYAELEKLA